MPTGWDLSSISCESSIGDAESSDSLELDAGETITCTFTNTKRGHIIVDKVTEPSGDPQLFSFNASGGTTPTYENFSLTDDGEVNDQELKPGNYSVNETVARGWVLTDISCISSIGDSENADALELDAGETITCTFTNTQQFTIITLVCHAGELYVSEVTLESGERTFSLSPGDVEGLTFNPCSLTEVGFEGGFLGSTSMTVTITAPPSTP